MKKIILGIVAAFALVSFLAPAYAEEAAAGGDKAAAEKPAKKGKKAKKDAEKPADAPAADAAKK